MRQDVFTKNLNKKYTFEPNLTTRTPTYSKSSVTDVKALHWPPTSPTCNLSSLPVIQKHVIYISIIAISVFIPHLSMQRPESKTKNNNKTRVYIKISTISPSTLLEYTLAHWTDHQLLAKSLHKTEIGIPANINHEEIMFSANIISCIQVYFLGDVVFSHTHTLVIISKLALMYVLPFEGVHYYFSRRNPHTFCW